jgi:VanZ family protein
MLGTLAVASADELHQLFLPNRTGSAWDVALDCCGGLVMQLLVGVWMERRRHSSERP